MKKFYTASKTKYAAKWQELRSRGYQVTSTWIDTGEDGTITYRELGERCLAEVQRSDFLLLYTQRPEDSSEFALIARGAALAFGIPVRLVGEHEYLPRVFNSHPLVRHFSNVEEAIKDAGNITVDAAAPGERDAINHGLICKLATLTDIPPFVVLTDMRPAGTTPGWVRVHVDKIKTADTSGVSVEKGRFLIKAERLSDLDFNPDHAIEVVRLLQWHASLHPVTS